MSSDGVLIKYKQDYETDDPEGKCSYKTFKMTIGPTTEEHKIRKSSGKSAEELMVETYEPVDVLLALFNVPATGPEKFRYLSLCLTGEAKAAFDRLVASDYPTNADKTHANFIVIKRDILTSLSDYTHPGDRVATYLLTVVSYTYCKDDNGVQVKPGVYLARWRKMELLGSQMEHSLGANYIPAETFKVAFFNSFPKEMKKWMTDEHMRNPMSQANPMDCQEIADFFQHYWTLHYADQKKQDKKRKSTEDKNDDNQGSNKRQKRNNDHKNNNNSNKNKNGGGRCALSAHRDFNHPWEKCHFNPENPKYDFDAAQRFYDTKAKGQDSWYKDVHTKQIVNRSRNNSGGGGRGRGNGGRNGGRGHYNNGGRGYGGRGRGGYNSNNYHNNQGGNNANQGQGGGNGNGYHYHDGYHNHQYQYQQQQPPQQPPVDQASYHFADHSRGAPQAPNVPSQGPPGPARGTYFGGRRI